MKKHLVIVLAVLSVFNVQLIWGQASTEGKDFWLASTIICQPPSASKAAIPYVAVSAQKACSVTITDYAGNQLATANVAAGSWTEFGNTANTNTNPALGPVNVYLDPTKWYPTTNNVNADDVRNHADKINNYGLHVTATENVSVFVILRAVNSMDASNILPLSALQSEYYTMDLYPEAKDVNYSVNMTTILATEDNTQVDITPSNNTYNNAHRAGVTYTITLNKGQTYYLITSVSAQLAGTHIMAKNGKKIAVYCGCPLIRNPTGISARDGLYEQIMPVDYWGTQFIATRSLEKDGNVIGITAMENGTVIRLNGHVKTVIESGETFYLMLQGPGNPYSNKVSTRPIDSQNVYTADEIYIETSCPCAVINYDTGNSFEGKPTEITNSKGDPSSVWIAPLQQKISKITFGACYTDKTQDHFLNIVTATATCNQTTLTGFRGSTPVDLSSGLTWNVVSSNAQYSYARIKLGESTPNMSVFTLENPMGFIAHVYGNGNDESYTYSCGSSAIKRGINLEGFTFQDGTMSDNKFCAQTQLLFDAQVGTDIIDRVDWNFGDGTTEDNGPVQIQHMYESHGWYDVTAMVYAHKDCPETVYPPEPVHFSFYITEPLIIHREASSCMPYDYSGELIKMDTTYYDCDSIVITGFHIRLESEPKTLDTIARDSLLLNGEWIYESGTKTYTLVNSVGCDSIVTYNVKILTCLVMSMPTDVNPECDGGTSVLIDFNKVKGDIASATFFKLDGTLETPFPMTISADGHSFVLDVSTFIPGTVAGRIEVYDEVCDETLKFPITIFVRLPNTILHQKYDNVVGVALDAIQLYGIQGYQWHLDGELKQGQSTSIYYQDNSFTSGQYIEVEVLLPNGKWIKSCRLNLTGAESMTNPFRQEGAEAQKVVRRGHIYILQEDGLYNTLGEKVE